eukprot:g16445.t1
MLGGIAGRLSAILYLFSRIQDRSKINKCDLSHECGALGQACKNSMSVMTSSPDVCLFWLQNGIRTCCNGMRLSVTTSSCPAAFLFQGTNR